MKIPEAIPGLTTITYLANLEPMANFHAIALPQCLAQELGEKVVSNYESSTDNEKKPYPNDSTKCYKVTYSRVDKAVKEICGSNLPPLDAFKTFDIIFGSKIHPKSSWLNIDEKYRGKGAAGAMASINMGELINEDGIWSGKLKPGAVLQIWNKDSDFEKVVKGEKPESIGHSFIFLKYVKDSSGKITGMSIADQGTGWDQPNILKQDKFEYWVGANLKCKETN